MSTWSSAAASGAGPSAAIRLDPGRHDAWNPERARSATAAWTWAGSTPNSVAYASGVTVRPEAMIAASRSGFRILSAKVSETVVAAPDGPSGVALRMAVARLGGGEASGWGTFAACRGGLLVGEVDGAHAASASTITRANRGFM